MKKTILIFGFAYLFLAIFIVALYNTTREKESNKIVFVWEGLEKDIPQNGEFIQITGTDENTVYLNAIDE